MTIQRFAESELQRMSIAYNTLTLMGDKDGVSVWRVVTDSDSYVMKCFGKQEHRREIANYQLLNSLGVPTLRVIVNTDYSIILEDIERGDYRLGTAEDLIDPQIAGHIAAWYRKLHDYGRELANSRPLYDECDYLTTQNIAVIKDKTDTNSLQIWEIVAEHFDKIKAAAMNLSRTLTYNDFYYTNLAVAKDNSAALVFDYNLLGKGYVYADIRNVCSSLGEEAKAAFISTYGGYDKREKAVDDVVSPLITLHFACQRERFPAWANGELKKIINGELLAAIEKLLEITR